jgi:O-antigen/teichoic acid export membrane protein
VSVKLQLFNLSLRALSLVGRFVLAMFMARYFQLAEIGLFGLIYSATAVTPALLGGGINFFLNREIVRLDHGEALLRVRDRLLLSLAAASILGIIIFGIASLTDVLQGIPVLWFVLVLIFEVVAFDLHYSLISMKRPLLANGLLFVRSASWTFPFVMLAFPFPEIRSLEALLQCWLMASLLGAAIFVGVSKNWHWPTFRDRNFDAGWFKSVLGRSKLVYLSDIAIVGLMFADRYVLGLLDGLEAVGVFVFFWTIANSVQVLIATAVSQIALPHMVDAHTEGGRCALLALVKRKAMEAGVLGGGLSGVVCLVFYFVVQNLDKPQFLTYFWLLPMLLLVAIIRSISDVLNSALYSAGKDLAWASLNIFTCAFLVGAQYVGGLVVGVFGIVAAGLFVAFIQVISRCYFLVRR